MAIGRPRTNDPLFEAINQRIRRGETRAEAVAAVAAEHDKNPKSLNSQYSSWRNRDESRRTVDLNPIVGEDPTSALVDQLKNAWRESHARLIAIEAAKVRLTVEEKDVRASLEQLEGLAKTMGLATKDLNQA